MVLSLRAISAVALALVGQVSAAKWELKDTYNARNFFDEFNFFDAPDPTNGYVRYRNKADATRLGLAAIEDGDVVLRPDSESTLTPATLRNSVRLESKTLYTHGLFIARFSHLPEPTCGVWPAFWTYGDPWVEVGEIDMYEQWNNRRWNQPAIHTDAESKVGACRLVPGDMQSTVLTANCDNKFADNVNQFPNQGCTVNETTGPFGSSSGGVYAMEWTSDHINLYAFTNANAPRDLNSDNPNPANWGTPSVRLRNSNCDIDNHFARQKLVLNIAFCGDTAGQDYFWQESGCIAKAPSCVDFVGQNPAAFRNSYFKVKDIRVFAEGDPNASSSTSTTSTSTTSSSSSSSSSSTSSVSTTSTSSSSSSSSASSSASASATASATQSSGPDLGSDSSSSSSTTTSSPTSRHNGSGSFEPTYAPSATICRGRNCPRPTSYQVSTVYTTKVHTVTNCPPYVEDCPNRHAVVTETIPLYTTLCPVEPEYTEAPKPKTKSRVTLTRYETDVYTITSCPDEKCQEYTTTKVRTTTYCPEDDDHVVTRHPTTSAVTVVIPRPSGVPCNGPECNGSVVKPNATKPVTKSPIATPSLGCTGKGCEGPVVVSGAKQAGVSMAALGLAAFALLI